MFGHFSHRSEWQLVKVDYKSIFDRRCAEEDYRPWQLHSQVSSEDAGVWPEVASDPTVQDQYDSISFPNSLVCQLVPYWVGLFCCTGVLASDGDSEIHEGWAAVFWVSSCTQAITSDLCRLDQHSNSRRTATEAWTPSLLHFPSDIPILTSFLSFILLCLQSWCLKTILVVSHFFLRFLTLSLISCSLGFIPVLSLSAMGFGHFIPQFIGPHALPCESWMQLLHHTLNHGIHSRQGEVLCTVPAPSQLYQAMFHNSLCFIRLE